MKLDTYLKLFIKAEKEKDKIDKKLCKAYRLLSKEDQEEADEQVNEFLKYKE